MLTPGPICNLILRGLLFQLFASLCFSDEHGDRPRDMPVIAELADAVDVYERKESPSWDYDVSSSHLLLMSLTLISQVFHFLSVLPNEDYIE